MKCNAVIKCILQRYARKLKDKIIKVSLTGIMPKLLYDASHHIIIFYIFKFSCSMTLGSMYLLFIFYFFLYNIVSCCLYSVSK